MPELTIHFDRADSAAAAVVPLDVIRLSVSESETQRETMVLGQTHQVQVEPGDYLVRAFLPSGEIVSQQIAVSKDEHLTLASDVASPRESYAWAYRLGTRFRHNPVFEGGSFGYAAFLRDDMELAEQQRSDSSELQLELWIQGDHEHWERQDALGPFQREALDNSEAEDVVALLNVASPVEQKRYWLRLFDDRTFSKFVAIPPYAWRKELDHHQPHAEILVTRSERQEEADPYRVAVRSPDPRVNALLSYLVRGDFESARRVSEPSLEYAEKVLRGKVTDPAGAAVAGYFLLRAGRLDRLHDWTGNLATWFEWLPDGPVIRAWHVWRGAKVHPDVSLIQDLLLTAVDRGLPLFTQGLRYLHDGLRLLQLDKPEDKSLKAGLEQVKQYALRADWQSPTTAFFIDDPRNMY